MKVLCPRPSFAKGGAGRTLEQITKKRKGGSDYEDKMEDAIFGVFGRGDAGSYGASSGFRR